MAYRLAQRLAWTPTGVKTLVVGQVESLFRRHSYVRSYSLRPVEAETTWLANPDNATWEDPFTGEVRNESFWDLYQAAFDCARDTVQAFDAAQFDEEAAGRITGDVNFRGQPTVATLTVLERG